MTWTALASGGLFIFTVPESENRSVVLDSLRPHRLCSPRNSQGQNTGVGNLSLLQGIFPTQGSNPALQADYLPAELSGKPNLPLGLRGKAGGGARVTAGPKRPHLSVMFPQHPRS